MYSLLAEGRVEQHLTDEFSLMSCCLWKIYTSLNESMKCNSTQPSPRLQANSANSLYSFLCNTLALRKSSHSIRWSNSIQKALLPNELVCKGVTLPWEVKRNTYESSFGQYFFQEIQAAVLWAETYSNRDCTGLIEIHILVMVFICRVAWKKKMWNDLPVSLPNSHLNGSHFYSVN